MAAVSSTCLKALEQSRVDVADVSFLGVREGRRDAGLRHSQSFLPDLTLHLLARLHPFEPQDEHKNCRKTCRSPVDRLLAPPTIPRTPRLDRFPRHHHLRPSDLCSYDRLPITTTLSSLVSADFGRLALPRTVSPLLCRQGVFLLLFRTRSRY